MDIRSVTMQMCLFIRTDILKTVAGSHCRRSLIILMRMNRVENVEYLLEWDVNDAFYDFPFVGNSVTFEKTAPETMNVAYDEDLYQKDLEYFETILGSFSLDINSVSMDSILVTFLKAGKNTLCVCKHRFPAKIRRYILFCDGDPGTE